MSSCACNRLCNNSQSFVDITGLCNLNDIKDLSTFNYWTQISIPHVFEIPEQKPDIEELNSENVTVEVLRKRVIITPADGTLAAPAPAENYEGKIETGRKLVIEGLICKAISYTALNEEQSIHSAHTSIPFSAYITLPRTIDIGTPPVTTDTLDIDFEVIPCVEDVYINQVCRRQIFENVTLFLQAVPASVAGCSENSCEDFDNILIKGVTSQDDLQKIILPATNGMWTQIVLSENLDIPDSKPDIEQISSLFSHVDIISQRVVSTPNSNGEENNEGTKLTGKKLIIEGVLKQKIAYTADIPEGTQPLHSAHFDIPFSTFIVVDQTTIGSAIFKVQPYIEDIFICAVDKRKVFKNTIIFINVTKCV